MGKNGFSTVLLLILFITFSLFGPLFRTNAFSNGEKNLELDYNQVPLQENFSLGTPHPMWKKAFGTGWANSWDIIQLQKGSLCVAGTFSYGDSQQDGQSSFAIFYMPPDDTLSSTTFGSGYADSTLSEARSVIQTDEGYIALAGAVDWYDTKSRAYMAVFYNGSMTPDSFYNGSVFDEAWSIIEHYPKGLVLAGVTESYGAGGKDVWLLHTDPNKFCTGYFGRRTALLWNRTYGGSGDDEGRCVINCSTGGFAITGFTDSFGLGGTDGWLIRTDADGNYLWSRTFGTIEDDELYSIIECQSGGYAMIGTSHYAQDPDMWSTMWVLRISELGSVSWQHFFGVPGSFCRGYDIVELDDGTFALAGSIQQSEFDMWLVRLAQDGTPLTFQTFGGSRDDEAHSITTVNTGGVALAGYTQSYGGGYRNVWVVRVPEDYLPTWVQSPSNQSILYNAHFHYNLNASDSSEPISWTINNTADFTISDQGLITNRTTLSVGIYPILVWATDAWGNTAMAFFYVEVLPPLVLPPLIWLAFVLVLCLVIVLSVGSFLYSYLRKRRTD